MLMVNNACFGRVTLAPQATLFRLQILEESWREFQPSTLFARKHILQAGVASIITF